MRLVVARLGKSLYEVVGVARGASNVEIKKVRRVVGVVTCYVEARHIAR